MSSKAHAHDSHGHGGAPGDHVPHVLPLSAYFGVFAGLLVFTAITVAVSRINLGSANLFIAMLIATCKALMVSLIFMHLAFDKKFNLVVFSSALIFLGVFISLTMFDTNWRNLGGRTSEDRPVNVADPFAETQSEERLKAMYEHKSPEGARGEHEKAAEHH